MANNENVQRRTRANNGQTQTQAQTNATQAQTQTTEQTNENANAVLSYSAMVTSVTKNAYNSGKVTLGINKLISSFDKDGETTEVNYININANRLLKECAQNGDTECAVIFGLLGDFKRPKANVLAFSLVGKVITFDRVLHESGEVLEDGEILQNTGYSTSIKGIKGTANPLYLPLLQKALIDNDLEEKATLGTTSVFDAMNV
jgi:hypothetical protein